MAGKAVPPPQASPCDTGNEELGTEIQSAELQMKLETVDNVRATPSKIRLRIGDRAARFAEPETEQQRTVRQPDWPKLAANGVSMSEALATATGTASCQVPLLDTPSRGRVRKPSAKLLANSHQASPAKADTGAGLGEQPRGQKGGCKKRKRSNSEAEEARSSGQARVAAAQQQGPLRTPRGTRLPPDAALAGVV